MNKRISGFSKLSKEEKINWVTSTYFSNNEEEATYILKKYWNQKQELQQLHDDFIENTVSNFYIPYGIAPNFVINDKDYAIPMAIEESSVVAAASLVAKFWGERGGFKAEVLSTQKVGQIHFIYKGDKEYLNEYFAEMLPKLHISVKDITKNMEKRGGGIIDIELRDKTSELDNYYQLHIIFETKDSMGANFINSCLEKIANTFKSEQIDIVMSILSNYLPNCIARAEVSCKVEDLAVDKPELFAQKFEQAVAIANADPHRATTHNKGIMNGIDAVVLATGNDFRAIEAGAHAYAAHSGTYKSLSHCEVKDGIFRFWIEIPLALGTIGGLTNLHPLAKFSLDLLQNPSARELMEIVAVAGLAQNFAALRALTTSGIQKGHMKMHLTNILNGLKANRDQVTYILNYFADKPVTHSEVVRVFEGLKGKQPKAD
ncbi:MAG: hydroxymethylglutaryl-CoA reductase, degradative [Flavobacteriaceae bacterium]|nr:hydroxymethylglutaryl-CoA reductase, degradative [Flavobacteriaceae bacterium]